MIDKALFRLRPNAHWVLNGNYYSGLVWLDQNQTKPTQQELEAEVERLQREYELTEYQRLRAPEYPDFKDFLDAYAKDDVEGLNEYKRKCMEVKAKYPKPSGVA